MNGIRRVVNFMYKKMAHDFVTYSCYLPVLTQFVTPSLPIQSIA